MEMKRKANSRDVVVDRAGAGTSAVGLEVVAQEERSTNSKTEKKRKRPRLERRLGSADRVGEEAVTFSENIEKKKETKGMKRREPKAGKTKETKARKRKEMRKRKEKAEDLQDMAAPCGEEGMAAAESEQTWKQPMRSGPSPECFDPQMVWVRGLPSCMSDDDIRDYFAKCGKLNGIYRNERSLRRDKSKQCLKFASEAGATKSLEYNGSDIGCSLKVWRFRVPGISRGWANVPKTPGVLVAILGDLPRDVDKKSIRAFLKKPYSGTKVKFMHDFETGRFMRKAYVKFGDVKSLDAAIKLNQTPLMGKRVKIAYSVVDPYTLEEWNSSQQKCTGLWYKVEPCHTCGNVRHTSSMCPKKEIDQCFICGEWGHNYAICSEKGFYSRALRLAPSQNFEPVHTYFHT